MKPNGVALFGRQNVDRFKDQSMQFFCFIDEFSRRFSFFQRKFWGAIAMTTLTWRKQ